MLDPQFQTDLKALADEYQVNIKGRATPVDPAFEEFDIEATVNPPATPVTPVDPNVSADPNATPDATSAS